MVSVRTSILGRPRRLSHQRHADLDHTLIWEEPSKVVKVSKSKVAHADFVVDDDLSITGSLDKTSACWRRAGTW